MGLRQAEGLRARAPGGTADPYACVSLSTRAGHRHETRVHRGTLCPVFGETCRFQVSAGRQAGGRPGWGRRPLTRPPAGPQVPPAELPGATLLVHVRDFQRFSRHEPLGTLSLPLGTVDLQHVLELWLPLGPPGSDEVRPLTSRLRPGPGGRAGRDTEAPLTAHRLSGRGSCASRSTTCPAQAG